MASAIRAVLAAVIELAFAIETTTVTVTRLAITHIFIAAKCGKFTTN